ncbi:hypothetical protein T484DRAFT_1811144 [Baffinella frigidus]|nr:hypothetical protein T484DRAFT_1811144 [Cryptophyta sp. CCMP2293]
MSASSPSLPILPSLATVLASMVRTEEQETMAHLASKLSRTASYDSCHSNDENDSASSFSATPLCFPWPASSADAPPSTGSSSNTPSSPSTPPLHPSTSSQPSYIPMRLPAPARAAPPRDTLPTAPAQHLFSSTSSSSSYPSSREPLYGATALLDSRRWRVRLDRKYAQSQEAPALARLRVALFGLTAALPASAKTSLVSLIRGYTDRELSPEGLADAVKGLVDEYDVRVPSGIPGHELQTV